MAIAQLVEIQPRHRRDRLTLEIFSDMSSMAARARIFSWPETPILSSAKPEKPVSSNSR